MHRPFRFSPPTAGATAALRPRLLAVLARRFDARLVTVVAGAGLGKTTLLGQAVAENKLAPMGRDCWLTCEPADSSPSVLLTALLRAVGAPEVADQPQVAHICEAVWAAAPEHVCLVLDDTHAIEHGSDGAVVLRRLLEELPENGHLVVAGRRPPDLARTRLALQDRAAEITADDLRLDDSESAMFAAARGVSADVVRHAGGWPALAELYAKVGRVHAERFASEEVLSVLSAREREAFSLVVAVGGADAQTLDAVAGGPFDRARVAELPLVDVDEDGGLRPHAIWEELLGDRIDPTAATAARRRLAAAMLERGDHGAAFELLASTGDWEHALPALFEACNDQRTPPWADQMERWRRLVPGEAAREPEVVYLEAMIERARDAWSPVGEALFADAFGRFQRRGDLAQEIAARLRALFIAWCRCDRATFGEMHTRALELVEAGFPLETIALFNRAAVADLDGRADEVRDLVAQFGPLEPRLRHFPGLLRVFASLTDGTADDAVADADDAAEAASLVSPAGGTGWALAAPAAIAWARGDVERVRAESLGDPGPRFALAERVPAIALAAVVAAHLGDVERAASLVAVIDALVPDLGQRDLLAGFRAVAAAATSASIGDEDGARTALEDGLAGRSLDAGGAGRAVHGLPSLPYLFHDGARALLDTVPSGPSRERSLAICRALLAARAGSTVPPALLEDVAALATSLPISLATELVVRAADKGAAPAHVGCIAALADLAPAAVRSSLRRFSDGPEPSVSRAARSLATTVPIPPAHDVRIEVLGPTRLLRDRVVVDDADWRRQRVRQMVCALVALGEIRRPLLGLLLWPEFDEKAMSANLRLTLTYLQALLEPHRERGDAPWFLRQTTGALRLRADEHLSVDAWEFEAELVAADAAAAAGTPSVELQHLLAAVGLWRGEYLTDVAGEEWADPLRERARQQFVRAAVRAGDLLVGAGRFAEAIALADRAVDLDPWCEAAVRLRVAGHLAAGDRAAALHAYETGQRALVDLGVAPEPATVELGRRLASGTR